MDIILQNTILSNNILSILNKYIPFCYYCNIFNSDLDIELSNLLQCYCDIDNIYCIHNVKYICNNCSITCKCGGKMYKEDI